VKRVHHFDTQGSVRVFEDYVCLFGSEDSGGCTGQGLCMTRIIIKKCLAEEHSRGLFHVPLDKS
jgi:hypothetical protein